MGTIYFPLVQGEGVTKGWLSRSMSYTLKTSVPPTSILPGVRAAVREIDPNLPLARARPLHDLTRAAQAQMASTMFLLGIAATVGLLLGSVGLYGVVSYVTSQRTQEIGLRMAMGAEGGSVQRMIVRQGLAVTGAGLAMGLGAAFVLSRFLEAMLFRVNARDPLTFGAVTAVLLVVSLLATWLPAARAAGTDPAEALRCD